MPINPSTPLVLLVCTTLTAACAASPPISKAAPPRLVLPEPSTRPCTLATLPVEPTLGDLETAYAARGAQIAACDAARRLAVETLLAERKAIDAWLAGAWGGPARQK